jgi:hypothetical protein
MTTRHRIPTIFNIYMLDVICCALGCVILLWQLKHGEAEEAESAAQLAQARWQKATDEVHTVTAEIDTLRTDLAASRQKNELLGADLATARQKHELLDADLAASRKKRELLSIEMARTEKDRDEANRLIALRKKEYDALREAWLASEAMLKSVKVDLAKLKEENRLGALELAEKVKANAELLLAIAAADKNTQALDKKVAAQKLDAEEAAKLLQAQLAKLQLVERKNKDLDKQLAALLAADKETLAKLNVQELRIKVLEQDLDKSKKDLAASAGDAQAIIAALQKEKLVLVDRARAAQLEAEQRFAGIALTGENVLFLLDMSGSMAMIDEKTPDPDKWPLVCETVVQLMRSIKGLAFFQVLLFSDRVRYPLGSPAAWLKYDPKTTPEKTLAVLKAIKPEGETNMHAVFTEAFRYREAKLDTIYVLSDGLPNAGDGLPANLTEAQRTSLLSKHLRAKLKDEWNRPIAGQKRVRINSIGFFFESPDVGAFLWALSREHNGSFVGMSK